MFKPKDGTRSARQLNCRVADQGRPTTLPRTPRSHTPPIRHIRAWEVCDRGDLHVGSEPSISCTIALFPLFSLRDTVCEVVCNTVRVKRARRRHTSLDFYDYFNSRVTSNIFLFNSLYWVTSLAIWISDSHGKESPPG